jgi:hypothetical protein
MTGAVVDEADDALAQLRGGVHVDLARDLQDGAVARADGFHLKGLHGWPSVLFRAGMIVSCIPGRPAAIMSSSGMTAEDM